MVYLPDYSSEEEVENVDPSEEEEDFDNIDSSDDGESQQTKLTKGEALDILKNYNELKEHSGLLRSPIQTQHLSLDI